MHEAIHVAGLNNEILTYTLQALSTAGVYLALGLAGLSCFVFIMTLFYYHQRIFMYLTEKESFARIVELIQRSKYRGVFGFLDLIREITKGYRDGGFDYIVLVAISKSEEQELLARYGPEKTRPRRRAFKDRGLSHGS